MYIHEWRMRPNFRHKKISFSVKKTDRHLFIYLETEFHVLQQVVSMKTVYFVFVLFFNQCLNVIPKVFPPPSPNSTAQKDPQIINFILKKVFDLTRH